MHTENRSEVVQQSQRSESQFISSHRQELDDWFDSRFAEARRREQDSHTPSMSIIATKGTLDWAYPPFILASTGAALGWDVSIFFTFYGLDLLKKELDLKVSPLGNPAMPMKMPVGPEWFKDINWNIPNILAANMPGFENFASVMMKKATQNKGVASIQELRDLCLEAEVKLIACNMTVELFGYQHDDFIPEVEDWVGAAYYLPLTQKADVSLFI